MLLFLAGLAVLFISVHPAFSTAHAQEWKTEFDDISQKTSDPISCDKGELKQLISRCDKLRPVMETLDESESEVYLWRLKVC